MLNFNVLNQFLNGRARTRLLVALLTGTAAFLLLPIHLFIGTRLLIGWNAGVICFLVLAYRMIALATPEETNRSAMRQDQSGVTILVLVVLAASTSLFAIGFLLSHAKELPAERRAWLILLSGIAVVSSWLLTHIMFTFHYAHRYYGDIEAPWGEADEGLSFPGGGQPDYLDFLYFAFVIAMTSQVSDVQITSRRMRRLVWIHSLLSFAFYTVILALTINIVAGLI